MYTQVTTLYTQLHVHVGLYTHVSVYTNETHIYILLLALAGPVHSLIGNVYNVINFAAETLLDMLEGNFHVND